MRSAALLLIGVCGGVVLATAWQAGCSRLMAKHPP